MIKYLLPLLFCGLVAAGSSSFCPSEGIRRFSLPRLNTRYVQCTEGVPTLNECEPGTVFDASLELCLPLILVAGDSGARVVECPDQSDSDEVIYIRHPKRCDVYFMCTKGVPYEQQCPEGTYFNPNVNVCDKVENVECVIHS
ncbi:peritrophin-1-like [Malaya genurostris]|uniref:peritrophin-1-like n=1 Tax=Malaya genurostris TaxID=325434 RepID=UPI0026F3FD93|nr:peritrophin-1-like [Malaya genurostris]